MQPYRPPLHDLRFVLEDVLDLPALMRSCGDAEVDNDTIAQVLEAAGAFAAEVIAPLNPSGDREGCSLQAEGAVRTPAGFRAAYAQFAADGWTALACSPAAGGQGLPATLNNAVYEMLCGANMAWASYPGMSHAAYTCLETNGSAAQKALYLPRIARGEWAGTMCLTEPHAGTDLGLLRTRAVARPDGSHAITGTKIFISGGEQDLTDNIVHLVLARLADSPPGVKGISLFIVPKFLPDAQGAPGERNAVSCVGLEDKMGIHANATCTMAFDGATGWLLGEADRGLAAMFVMMNHARLVVGVNAIGLMEAARQKAQAYAEERVQGRAAVRPADAAGQSADPIVRHPDVRRMLMTQAAHVEGARALALWASSLIDVQHRHPAAQERARAAELLAIATPVVKAFSSDNAIASILLSMQCFGGHGYVRDNGVEQHLRDARIIPLYEGTNGVQAMDLLGRKVLADGGERLRHLIAEITTFRDTARESASLAPEDRFMPETLAALCESTGALTARLIPAARTNPEVEGEVAAAYLRLVGHLMLAWMWARMAVAASGKGPAAQPLHAAKRETARFYFRRMLPEVQALAAEIDAVLQAAS